MSNKGQRLVLNLNNITSLQNGRRIINTQTLHRSSTKKIHLWGMQDGHTVVVHEDNHRFVEFEEHSKPLGIVAASFR